jgi:hypothetical protein
LIYLNFKKINKSNNNSIQNDFFKRKKKKILFKINLILIFLYLISKNLIYLTIMHAIIIYFCLKIRNINISLNFPFFENTQN